MSKSQLKSRPPVVSDADREKAAESFVSGAKPRTTPQRTTTKASKVLPWEEPYVREDVKKPYNLRLPEAYLLKLKYVAENTPDSMQTFCLGVLLPAIDKKVEELLEKGP